MALVPCRSCKFISMPSSSASASGCSTTRPAFTVRHGLRATSSTSPFRGQRSSFASRSPSSIAAYPSNPSEKGRRPVDPLLIDKWDDYEEREQAMDRLVDPNVVEPDLDDPDWPDAISNWWDFWNYGAWDREIVDLDDDEDAQKPKEDPVMRAVKMIAAIQDISSRPDVVNWLPEIKPMDDEDTWEEPPVIPERPDLMGAQSLSDVRAIAEKRRRKETLDAEWRRRQATIGRVQYTTPNVYNDVRLAKFAEEYDKPSWQWTDEDVYKLITLDGINCRPEDHGAVVENPLLPIDYVAAGVKVIEETEEFLESIGHYATPDMMERFKDEYELDGVPGDDDDEGEAGGRQDDGGGRGNDESDDAGDD